MTRPVEIPDEAGDGAPAVPQPADDLERLHLAASALADLWHVPIDVFWQTRKMHLEILRGSAVPQPADREALRAAHYPVGRKVYVTPACGCGWFGESFEDHFIDAVLAVLAGEQEQVAPE